MKSNNKKENFDLQLSARRLKGKQSVRATFRLSDQMIDLLKVAANHLEVKQKSLIDELVQNSKTLDRVAADSLDVEQEQKRRRQKTFVLSRNSLDLLDDISRKYNISRDYLVELCISRLIPFVASEQEKHAQRRQMIKECEQYLSEGKRLLKQSQTMLGPDDRFCKKLDEIVTYTNQGIAELSKLVKQKESLIY